MEQDLFSDANEDIIGSASAVEEIICALARRGCSDLTSSINLAECSDFPRAGGGSCDVYKGSLSGGLKIAIKSLRIYEGSEAEGDSEKQKILKRAARELYYWSKLQHVNVIPLMGLAIFRGHISMISPWMEKGNLMSYLRLNPNVDRFRLCIDICEGLWYIHTKKMAHGDLKAANVMVAVDGTAMLADFGNARLNELTMKFTSTTKRGFSVRWAAPELLSEEGGPQVSEEADVYAYGMTALETLTGEVPYEGVAEHQVIVLVLIKGKVPARPKCEISDELWNLLNSCWTREPARRPSMAAVQNRLQTLARPISNTFSIEGPGALTLTSQQPTHVDRSYDDRNGLANEAAIDKHSLSSSLDEIGVTLFGHPNLVALDSALGLQSIYSGAQPSHPPYNNLSRAAYANEGLTAHITGPDTSSHFSNTVFERAAAVPISNAQVSSSSKTQPANNAESSQSANEAPVRRPLTSREQYMIGQLDNLKYFLATAPSRWSTPSPPASDARVQHPQTASHPAMNRFLLPSGEFVSCVLWGGLYHITGTDIVRALVFRFDAFARPVRNMKKFEEGVFSDLRNLKSGNDACIEEPNSPFLDLLFKYHCIRTQKKQKVFYWFSVPHDRLFLDALERDLKREKMGLEPTTVVVGEPARSFSYDPKRTLYEQFIASRGRNRDEFDQAIQKAESVPGNTYSSGLGSHNASQSVVPAPDTYAPLQPQEAPSGLEPRTKAYICPLLSCGRLYREPRYLKEHIRSHTVDKPYQCVRCFKQFSRTDHLGQHHCTHARADNGDPQALIDLDRVDEEEMMLMGDKTHEVEVGGEVEDVVGEPGELHGLGVLRIYPSSNPDPSAFANPIDDYSEVAASPPPSNLPYPGMSIKSSPNGAMAHWRAQHGASSLSSARSVPSGRWPSDTESWDIPRSQSALGYAWNQRSVSPAYSAISAPISHAPHHRPNTTDPMRASLGYMQSAPSRKQSFDAPGYFPGHPTSGALRRHRSRSPFQSHRHMSMALRRTSASGPDEVDLAGATSRYHPYGHAAANRNHYSSASSPAPYPQAVDQRATSTLSNAIGGATPEATYSMNNSAYPAVANNGYYPEEHKDHEYDVGNVREALITTQ